MLWVRLVLRRHKKCAMLGGRQPKSSKSKIRHPIHALYVHVLNSQPAKTRYRVSQSVKMHAKSEKSDFIWTQQLATIIDSSF